LLLVVCFLSFVRSCILCGSNPSIVVTTVFAHECHYCFVGRVVSGRVDSCSYHRERKRNETKRTSADVCCRKGAWILVSFPWLRPVPDRWRRVFAGFTVSRFQKIPFPAWNGRGCFRLPGGIPSPVGNRSRAFGIDIYYYLRATPLRRSLSKRTRNVAVEIVRPQKSSC